MPFADINGTRLHYSITGSGLPVVFVHPPLLEGNSFVYQQEQLSDSYQVITFDIRGHGRSRYSELPVTFPLLARDICMLLEYLHIPKAYICGYSIGGAVALETILADPGRFYGGILLSAMSEVSDPVLRRSLQACVAAAKYRARRFLTAVITIGNANSFQTFRKLYRDSMKGDIRNQEQYYRQGLIYNCTVRLKDIHVPMLLLYGEKNFVFHKYANVLHRHLPFSSLQFIREAKHQLPTKWHSQTNERIRRWIREQITEKESPSG
ncbi:alpha/beta fold hydrolase [Paenibacillus chartarius]|uniref:Alpha/beta fold hydrolase n=1 Tax=Paenibacillus chartarius TaxID=747481 RepID=A0ABV6DGP2_9BACL